MAWVQDCFVYQAVYTKLDTTTHFCIFPNGSYILILKTNSEYMLKRLVAVRVLVQRF